MPKKSWAIQALSFMRKRPAALAAAAFFAFLLSPFKLAHGFACQSNGVGDWNVAGSWTNCNSTIPQSTDNVTIRNGHIITLNTNSSVSSVTVQNGGTLTADSNSRQLTLTNTSGILFNINPGGTFNPGNSTVVASPNANVTVTSGTIQFHNLTFSPTVATSGKAYTMGGGSLTINGNFTINPNAGSALALTVNLASTTIVLGTTTIQRTGSATATLTTTASNHLFTTGNLNIQTAGTFTANGSTVTLNGTGTLFTQGGTFNSNTSVVQMNGDSSATLTSGAATFYYLVLNPSLTADRTYSFGSGNINLNGSFTINPYKTSAGNATLTVQSGSILTVAAARKITIGGVTNAYSNFDTGANYAISTGQLEIQANGALTANNSAITLTGAAGPVFARSGTFTPGGSTVTVSANAALNPVTSGAATFYNLVLSPTITGAQTYTLGSGALTVNGNLTINPTKTTAGAQTLTVNMGADIDVAATGLTTLTGTTNGRSLLNTVAGSNYLFSTGNLNITANGTFTANGSTVTLTGASGTLITRAGTFNHGTSHVIMNPDATVTLTNGATAFYKLSLTPTLANTQTYTFGSGALTINDDLIINPDKSSAGNETLNVTLGGSLTGSASKTLTVSGTNNALSNFSTGSNQAVTFGKIVIGTNGTLTANGSTLTLIATSGPLLTNNGAFAEGTSTVVMNPNATINPLTSGAVTFYNLNLTPTLTAPQIYTFGSGSVQVNGAFGINPTAGTAQSLTVNLGADMTVVGFSTVTRTTSATAVFDTTANDYAFTTGNLNVAAGGTFNANNSTITLTGTTGTLFTRAGTFNQGFSHVVINPNAAVTLTSGLITFHKLSLTPTLASSGKTYTLGSGALTINDDFLINPNAGSALALTVNMGADIVVAGTTTLTHSGSASVSFSATATNYDLTSDHVVIGSGDAYNATGSTITLTGDSGVLLSNAGTFTPGTSVVYANADADVTLTSGSVTFGFLVLNSTITTDRTFSFGSGDVAINQNFTINPTKTTGGTATLTVNLGGGATIGSNGTLTLTGTTNGRSLLDTGASSHHALSAGHLTIAANGTFNANNSTITLTGLSGTLFTRAGTFNQGFSHVVMNPNAAVTLTSGLITFHKLSLTPTLASSGKTYTLGSGALTINDDFTINPDAGSALTLTVNMGADIVVAGTTTIQNTGSASSTFTATATNYDLTSAHVVIGSGGTYNATGSTITLTGTSGILLSNSGTFTPGSSVVNAGPDADVTLTNGSVSFWYLVLNSTITADRAYTFGSGALSIGQNVTINPTKTTGGIGTLTVRLGGDTTIGSNATLTLTGATNGRSLLDTGAASHHALSAGRLNIAANGTFNANNSTVTLTGLSGTLFTRAGTFNQGFSHVVMSPNATVTLTSNDPITFYNLSLTPTVVTSGKAYTFGTALLDVLNDFVINPNAGSALALTVNLSSTTTVGGATTVTRTGSATSSLTTTASNHLLTTANIDIAAGGTFTANGSTVTLTGASGTLFTRNGTFTPNTSVVSMNPDADVTLTAGAATFYYLILNPTLSGNRVYTLGGGNLNATHFIVDPAGSANNLTVNMGAVLDAAQTVQIIRSGSATSVLDTGSYPLIAATLTIEAGGTLEAGNSLITLDGTTGPVFTRSGTFNAGGSTVTVSGNAALNPVTSGAIDFSNITLAPTITGAQTYTLGSQNLSVSGNFTINPTKTTVGVQTLTVNMGAPIIVDPAGVITLTGTTNGRSNLTTVSGSNFPLSTGRLDIQANGTFTANNSTITLNGTLGPLLTRSGAFTAGGSTVTVNTTAGVSLTAGSAPTFMHLLIDCPGATETLGTAMTVSGNLMINNGTLEDGGFQITGNATNDLVMAAGTDLVIGSAGTATTFPTAFTAANISLNAASTVTYNAGVNQTISGTPVYGHLSLVAPSGTPTKTLGAATTVAGDLTINSNNTLSVGAGSLGLTIGGNYTNNGTFTANTGTVTFTAAASGKTLSGNLSGSSQFGYLTFNGSGGGWTPQSALVVTSTLAVTAGTLSGANDITVNGGVIGNGTNGSINLTGGTFRHDVAANQWFGTNAAGANNWTFNNLTFANSSAVNRVITTPSAGTGQIIVNGTLAVGDATDTNTTTLSNAGNRVIDANSHLTITNRGALQGSSSAALTVGGDWTNSGAFTANSSTVTFDGGATQTLTGPTTFHAMRAVTNGGTLRFTAGTTFYVTGLIDLKNINLRSTSNDATWYFRYSGSSQTLLNLDVRDSNASLGSTMICGGVNVNSGNNTNWDFGPPAAIATFLASQGLFGASIQLSWTAPGDDGVQGTLVNSTFTIQYTTDTAFAQSSSWTPTSDPFSYVFRLNIATTNVAASSSLGTTLTGLTNGGTYYFRIWTKDDVGLYSDLSAGATTWATWTVLSVNVSPGFYSFGQLPTRSTGVATSSITITNNGNTTQRYSLQLTNPAGWTAVTAPPGADEFRFAAVFSTTTPTVNDFGSTDIVTTGAQTSTSTQFAVDGESNGVKGYSVPVDGDRGIWFRFESPYENSVVNQQSITVTITAQQD